MEWIGRFKVRVQFTSIYVTCFDQKVCCAELLLINCRSISLKVVCIILFELFGTRGLKFYNNTTIPLNISKKTSICHCKILAKPWCFLNTFSDNLWWPIQELGYINFYVKLDVYLRSSFRNERRGTGGGGDRERVWEKGWWKWMREGVRECERGMRVWES